MVLVLPLSLHIGITG